jgi:hypothetical protein
MGGVGPGETALIELSSQRLASLPLLLWKTPPGLELILAQEGVPFETVKDPHPLPFRAGRFVLFDSQIAPAALVQPFLERTHVLIDVDGLRRGETTDPFAALVDHGTGIGSWTFGGFTVSERVARYAKGRLRRHLIGRLREAVIGAGGVWMRVSPFPYPYRSAFSFRADLDESVPEDYHRFALARAALGPCSTHFVSTYAYTHHQSVLADLKRHDTQSHGHFHHVYRDAELNRVNLDRAHRILCSSGFEPVGFAAPHGRWRASLDEQLEDLGYLYSSDFQIGYDDFPFYPWRGDRFSRVLQIPVHPVCEGLFLDSGVDQPELIGDYFRQVIESRLDAGELAVIYGHPERRLGRMPEIMKAIASAVDSRSLVWRASFSDLARWWRWRAQRRWMVIPREDDRLDIQFDEWDPEYAFAVDIQRGPFQCSVPVTSSRMSLGLRGLVYERRGLGESGLESPQIGTRPLSLKRAVKAAIDWETVTPLDQIPLSSIPNRVKRGLRWWKLKRSGAFS